MRKKQLYLIAFIAISILWCACKKPLLLSSSIEQQNISFARQLNEEFPFADTQTLKSFASDATILNYEFAKKLALSELIGTGQWEAMNWQGATLSATPVIIYDFNSKPKFYNYIVLDPEQQAIGSVVVYAQRKRSTMLRSVSSNVPDFSANVTKSSSIRVFEDWTGTQYTAMPGKSGDAPASITNANGESVTGIQELTDEEIADVVANNLLTVIQQKNDSFVIAYKDSLTQNIGMEELEKTNFEDTKNALLDNMQAMHQQRDSFWTVMATIQDSINTLSVDEIEQKSTKGLFSWLRQVFCGVDTRTFGNGKYEYTKKDTLSFSRSGWCGPWVAGYLHYKKFGKNEYSFFENCASTTGLFFLSSFFRIANLKPMWPGEFAWSLAVKSGIGVSPILHFDASQAYWHIRNTGQPVIRMCSADGQLHWTLCYQTQQGGSRWWTQYKFRQIDNGSKINNLGDFTEMDWWNLYLKVWWT